MRWTKSWAALALLGAVAACSDAPTSPVQPPAVPQGALHFNAITDATTHTVTHDFEGSTCISDFSTPFDATVMVPDAYEGLAFHTSNLFFLCASLVAQTSTIVAPFDAVGPAVFNVAFDLDSAASAVSIEDFYFPDAGAVAPILNAYDGIGGTGNLVGSSTDASGGNAWNTVSVSGAGIRSVVLAVPNGGVYLDNLVITYPTVAPPPPPPPTEPTSKADCKNGGWAAFGFRNQGQCIRYVETNKDHKGKKDHDDKDHKDGRGGKGDH